MAQAYHIFLVIYLYIYDSLKAQSIFPLLVGSKLDPETIKLNRPTRIRGFIVFSLAEFAIFTFIRTLDALYNTKTKTLQQGSICFLLVPYVPILKLYSYRVCKLFD